MWPTVSPQSHASTSVAGDDVLEHHACSKAKPRCLRTGDLSLALTCLCPCHSKGTANLNARGLGWAVDALGVGWALRWHPDCAQSVHRVSQLNARTIDRSL